MKPKKMICFVIVYYISLNSILNINFSLIRKSIKKNRQLIEINPNKIQNELNCLNKRNTNWNSNNTNKLTQDKNIVNTIKLIDGSVTSITKENLNLFKKQAIDEHNRLRKFHNSPPLILSEELEMEALSWAITLSNQKTILNKYKDYKITNEDKYQNVMRSSIEFDSIQMTDVLYSEVNKYNYDNSESNKKTNLVNEFTQIVWKNTKFIGCGIAHSKYDYWGVCIYSPAGNIAGSYSINVLKPTVSADEIAKTLSPSNPSLLIN